MRRTLFPTMCLLLWATTAHAEFAWVLWAEVARAGKIWGRRKSETVDPRGAKRK